MLTRSKRNLMIGVAGAAILALAGCGGASGGGAGGTDGEPGAAGGGSLRLAMNSGQDHPIYLALESFAENFSEATDGRWTIKIFPNETLGTQQETLQLVGDGTLDFAMVSSAQMENLNLDFLVFNLPGVFESTDHVNRVINNEEIVADLYTSLEDDNLTVVGAFGQGARSIYTTDAPVENPADMNGKKIRIQESELFIDMIDLMGGSATPMSYGEVYTALQSGVLDGAENNEVSYASAKHYEVAPFYSYTQHQVGIDYLVASTTMLNGMSDEDRAIFEEQWDDTLDFQNEIQEKKKREAIAEAEAGGATFYEIDNSVFLSAFESLADKYLTTDTSRELYEATRALAD